MTGLGYIDPSAPPTRRATSRKNVVATSVSEWRPTVGSNHPLAGAHSSQMCGKRRLPTVGEYVIEFAAKHPTEPAEKRYPRAGGPASSAARCLFHARGFAAP